MRIVGIAVTGIVVFAATAAAGWYLRGQTPVHSEAGPETANAVDLTADPLSPLQNNPAADELMPVAVREKAMSVEELLRFSLSLKERDRLLKNNEAAFREQQVQQQLVLTDIRTEQTTIDELRTQIAAELASAGDLIDELNRLRDLVIAEREKTKTELSDIESKRIDISEQFRANDKKLSTWLQGMSSENAAAVLKEMANDGNMKIAVQLLANFEEREAAKILDSINDPKLLNEFIAEFRNLKNSRTGTGTSSAKPGPTSIR